MEEVPRGTCSTTTSGLACGRACGFACGFACGVCMHNQDNVVIFIYMFVFWHKPRTSR